MIHITAGNNKIGKTASISLPPVLGCVNYEQCKQDCYAIKFYKMYPDCKKAWDENLQIVIENESLYFEQIRRYLLKYQPSYFRYHIAGDILSDSYFDNMKIIAKDYYWVNFLAFTKNYMLVFEDIPINLSIVISVWPGMTKPEIDLPMCFIEGDKRAINYIKCKNNCEGCRVCWNLLELNKNVLLHKH